MSDKLLIESDNIVTWDGLTDAETGAYVNDADSMLMSLFKKDPLSPKAEAAVMKGGGEVGIPCTAHGQVAGDFIRIEGSLNYNDELEVQSATADEIVITHDQDAETFTGNERIFIGVPSGNGISLSYVADSDGVYKGNIPDTLGGLIEYVGTQTYGELTETGLYYLFVEAVKDSARRTKRMALEAAYDS